MTVSLACGGALAPTLLLIPAILAATLAAAEKPEDILKEAVAYYEKAANADKAPPPPKEELDLDEEVLDDNEAMAVPKTDSAPRLISAGERYAREQFKDGDPKKAVRMYRALLDYRRSRSADAKDLRETAFALAGALTKAGSGREAVALVAELRKGGASRLGCAKATFDATRGFESNAKAFGDFAKVIEDPANGFDKAEKSALWDYFGMKAFYSMDEAIMRQAIAAADRRGVRLSNHGAMCYWAVGKFEELKTFPKDESEIVFPRSLSAFGVDPNRKVVHAKDFGWDEEDATPCLEAAFDSDASTIVIDNMDKPWYVTGLRLEGKRGSNRQVVIRKGVRIYGKDDGASWMSTLVSLRKCEKTVWIAEDDVVIGHFPTLADRKVKQKSAEGGTGISIEGGHDVALVNLRVAYCCCDGLTLSGGVRNIFVDNCDFDGNYRQGASFGAAEDVAFRKTRFRNTGPIAAPGSGVDFEPSYEVYPNNNFYFFDCEFADNAGDGMTLATSTYLPVTVCARRCTFASTATALLVKARPGIYWENNHAAPSKIVFEDCRFFGNSEVDPIRFQSTSLFNVTFRNCTLKDRGPFYKGREPNAPAIRYLLDRDIWKGPCALDGLVTFENFVIEGYSNAPTFQVSRKEGVTYEPTRFAGEILHNGKKIPLKPGRFP